MKRIVSLCLVMIILVSMYGCASSDKKQTNNNAKPSPSDPVSSNPAASRPVPSNPVSSDPAPSDHVHQYTEWTVVEELTCETDGIKTRKCTTCDETEVETTTATGHSYENNICVHCKYEKPIPSDGLTYELNEKKDGYIVTSMGSFNGESLVIPDTYEGLPVVTIGENAFANSMIKSVYISDSVTVIDALAFRGCTSLETVHGMYNVRVIVSYAFSNCSKISEFSLPNKLYYLGTQVFSGCTELTSLHIPASTTGIGGLSNPYSYESSYYSCPVNVLGATNLTSLTVDPNNTVYIGNGNCLIHRDKKKLLAGCANSIVPADGSVTSIADYAFAQTQLEQITLPDGIVYIGFRIFDETPFYYDRDNWKTYENGSALYINNYLIKADIHSGTFIIDEGTILVADSAFWGCKMSKVQFPGSLRYLSDIFSGYTSLKEIIFEHGLETLPNNMMLGVDSIESITLPSSITYIGRAFYGKLQSIHYEGTKEQWEAIDKDSMWNSEIYFYDPLTIYCTDGEIVITEYVDNGS